MYNRDWDFGEEPQNQIVKVDMEEYQKMQEKLDNFKKFKDTIKELLEEENRTLEEKIEDIEEEINYLEDVIWKIFLTHLN